MSLFQKPHTASVSTVAEVTAAGVVTRYSRTDSGVDVTGQLDQLTPQQALEQWGFEVSHPAVFFADLADKDLIKPGDRLSITSSVAGSGTFAWSVVAGGEDHDADSLTSHVRWLLERST